MNRAYLYFFYLLLISAVVNFSSCKKPLLFAGGNLSFSQDTVVFDTVFTTLGSTTQQFKFYNNDNKTINVEQIELMGGESSPYRINVDGVAGTHFTNIELEGKDSLFVFVEVTLDPNNGLNPMIIEDSIRFRTNGSDQYVNLAAWGQDAYFHYKDINSTSVRRVLNRGIKRLNETAFHTLINDPEGDLEEIFGILHKKQIFRYITGLSANYDEELHSTLNDLDEDDFERVSIWKMSLDEQVFQKLLDPEKRQVFLAHTTIMHEGQGLAQTIYNFFSSVIGRTDQTVLGEPEKKYTRKVSVLKNTLFPERRIDKFQDDLVELMKKYLSEDVK